jgi:hypothetical protein
LPAYPLFASWKTWAEQSGQFVGDAKTFRARLELYNDIEHKAESGTKRAGFKGVLRCSRLDVERAMQGQQVMKDLGVQARVTAFLRNSIAKLNALNVAPRFHRRRPRALLACCKA